MGNERAPGVSNGAHKPLSIVPADCQLGFNGAKVIESSPARKQGSDVDGFRKAIRFACSELIEESEQGVVDGLGVLEQIAAFGLVRNADSERQVGSHPLVAAGDIKIAKARRKIDGHVRERLGSIDNGPR